MPLLADAGTDCQSVELCSVSWRNGTRYGRRAVERPPVAWFPQLSAIRMLTLIDEHSADCLDRCVAAAHEQRLSGAAERSIHPRRCDDAVHRVRQCLGERLRGELQWQAAGRDARSRAIRYAAGGEVDDRTLATRIQHAAHA